MLNSDIPRRVLAQPRQQQAPAQRMHRGSAEMMSFGSLQHWGTRYAWHTIVVFFFQFFYVCLFLCSMFHAPSKHQISFPKQAVCLDTLLGAAPLAGPKNPKKEGFTVLPNVVPVFFLPLPLLFFSPQSWLCFPSPLCANTGSTRISAWRIHGRYVHASILIPRQPSMRRLPLHISTMFYTRCRPWSSS